MTEAIIVTIFQSFTIGLFVGFILGINKKIMWFIWAFTILICIVGFIIVGGEAVAVSFSIWGVWNWICMIIFVGLGSWVGENITKEIWKKKK